MCIWEYFCLQEFDPLSSSKHNYSNEILTLSLQIWLTLASGPKGNKKVSLKQSIIYVNYNVDADLNLACIAYISYCLKSHLFALLLPPSFYPPCSWWHNHSFISRALHCAYSPHSHREKIVVVDRKEMS